MQGLYIDPIAREIRPITVPEADGAVAELLGCQNIDRTPLLPGEDLWVDDEGLMVKPHPRGYFALNGWAFAGAGVVLGNTEDGEARDTDLTPDRLLPYIEWIDPNDPDIPEPEIRVEFAD